jgi:hypothetical protein
VSREGKAFLTAGVMVLLISFPAMVAVASWIMGFKEVARFAGGFWVQIVVGFIAMFAVLFTTSGVAPWCVRSFFITGLYFVGLFLVGAVAASATSLFLNPIRSYETLGAWVHGWVGKPVLALAMFGTIPAFLLGLLGRSLLLGFVRDWRRHA